MLHAVTHGTETEATPLLIAHGLFGSARNWGVIAKRLSESRRVVAVDMRNHGASPWHDTHSYPEMAADLAGIIEDGQWDVLGHSMGGKAAMVLALTRPERIRRLVVADIAPVAYGHSQQSMIDAMRRVDLSKVRTRGDADRQLRDFVEDDGVRAFLLQSLDAGEQRWRLNLDVLSAEMPRIIGFPTDLTGHFDGPALFLSGGESDYVRTDHRAAIRSLFPAARFAKVPGAGHWLHAEKPREFEAALRVYLDST